MAIRTSRTVTPNRNSGTVVRSAFEPFYNFIYDHYHSLAYATVIITYLFGFIEYLIIRMKSLIWPERQIQFSNCEKHSNELLGKEAYHYAVVLLAFITVALFQLFCFFGLTISSKWMYCTTNEDFDRNAQLRQELAARIRSQVYNTLFPTFVCYILCALSINIMIYYMDGIQDAVDSAAANILLYIFDSAILSYFSLFLLINCLYRRQPSIVAMRRTKDDNNNNNILYMKESTNAIASTNSSGLAPTLFSRRYLYMITNDHRNHYHERERQRVYLSITHRAPSNFVRNTKLTTTI